MLDHIFETVMDTIWNSGSVGCRWEFVFFFALGAAILEQVVDLVGYAKEEQVWVGNILFGYEVAY
jgi:hypothetical protein